MPEVFDEKIHILHLAPPTPSSSIVTPNFTPYNVKINEEKNFRRKIVPKRMLLLVFAFLASSILVANQVHLLYNFSRRMDHSRLLDINAAADDDDANIVSLAPPANDLLSWYPDEIVEWSANTKAKRTPKKIKESNSVKSISTSIQSKTMPKEKYVNVTKISRQNKKRAKALKNNKLHTKRLPWSLPPIPKNQSTSEQFMKELSAYKQSLGIPLPWETTPRSNLPLPIISLSLPKSATTTTRMYFNCGNLTTAHTNRPFATTRIGDCMRDNFLNGTSPFHGCETNVRTKEVVNVWTDIGIPDEYCFYSSLHDGGLEHIAKFYPNATLLLVVRDSESWIASIKKWAGGRLLRKWRDTCGFPLEKPVKGETVSDRGWMDFYEAHTEKVRNFAKKHPQMTYVEVKLGDASAHMMEFYCGIPYSCFGDCHPGKRNVKCGLHSEKPKGEDNNDDDENDQDESESRDEDENDDDDDDIQ